MKRQAQRAAFERFVAVHEDAVWNEVLKARREVEGVPNWRPRTLIEGVSCQRQARDILWERFRGGST